MAELYRIRRNWLGWPVLQKRMESRICRSPGHDRHLTITEIRREWADVPWRCAPALLAAFTENPDEQPATPRPGAVEPSHEYGGP